MAFITANSSSTTITMHYYDSYGNVAALYPFGGFIEWSIDGSYYGDSQLPPGERVCTGITFRNLYPGRMYTIEIHLYMYDQYGEIGADLGKDSTTGTTLSRPAYFAWTVPKISGDTFFVGADEWVALTNNINAVLAHAGYSYTITQTRPFPGDILTAARYNDLRAAIQSVPGYGYYIPQVSSGQIVTAQQLNLLVSELNAIP